MSDHTTRAASDREFFGYIAFLKLPHEKKRALAARFNLVSPDDRKEPEEKQYTLWLIKAKYRGILSDVLDASCEVKGNG